MRDSLMCFMYCSEALCESGSQEEMAILRSSVANNSALALTGILYRCADRYIQYLEGCPMDLLVLGDKLTNDRRHKRIHLLTCGSIGVRRFPDWLMGFTVGNESELRSYLGVKAGDDPFDTDPVRIVDFLDLQSRTLIAHVGVTSGDAAELPAGSGDRSATGGRTANSGAT